MEALPPNATPESLKPVPGDGVGESRAERDRRVDALGRELLDQLARNAPPARTRLLERRLQGLVIEMAAEFAVEQATLLSPPVLSGWAYMDAMMTCQETPGTRFSRAFREALPEARADLASVGEWVDRDLLAAQKFSPEEQADFAAIVEAVDALPDRERRWAYQHFAEQAEPAQIAAKANVSVDEVERVLLELDHRARFRSQFWLAEFTRAKKPGRRP